MKKNLFFLAALSVAVLPFFFSCGKPDNGGGNVEILLPDPPTKDAAKMVVFPADNLPKYVDSQGEYEITQIEFTEASRYILKRRVIATKANVGDIQTIVGNYTESGGNYNCQGFGNVTVSGSGSSANVDVKPDGSENKGNEYTGKANVTSTPTPSTQDQKNATRNWSVNSVFIKVSGKGLEIEAPFSNGCDLEEIAKWAANNGVSGLQSRLGEFSGYKVQEVSFSGNNTFVINFTGAKTNAVEGTYSMNPTAKTVRFSLPEGNAFFHGSVDGSYEFLTEKTMSLSMNPTVEGYNCSLEMKLTRLD